MSRLRKPVRAIREPFGTAGLIVAVVALVFALTGGAMALTASSGGKHYKKAKAVKGPRGPRGKTGPAGPQGPAGPAGPAGTAGAKGDKGDPGPRGEKGDKGDPGDKGEPGDSPVGFAFDGDSEPPSEPCNGAGGVEYEVESTGDSQFVCNGAGGTGGGSLASGATETGVWGLTATPSEAGYVIVPISFPQPLPDGPEANGGGLEEFTVRFETESDFETTCGQGTGGAGGSILDPKAPPKTVCVWVFGAESLITEAGLEFVLAGGWPSSFGATPHPSKPGTFLLFTASGSGGAINVTKTLGGAWAVTN